jgi:hypothetical protein
MKNILLDRLFVFVLGFVFAIAAFSFVLTDALTQIDKVLVCK